MDEKQRREQRRRRKIQYVNRATFNSFIRQIHEALDTGISISSNTVEVIDCIIFDLFQQLTTEAKDLMLYKRRRTLMEQDISYAVKKCFSVAIARRAIEEGRKAVDLYDAVTRRKQNR